MRACVEESLLVMFMILGGAKIRDFGEDRDWSTYPGVSILCLVNRSRK